MSSLNFIIPEAFKAGAAGAAGAISELDQTVVAAHVNLDGDALGSLAACGQMLKCLEREFALYSSTGIPDYLDFLELPGPIYASLADIPFEPQSAIFLDCSDTTRLGPELSGMVSALPSVNIDHHLTEHGLGSLYNYIDPAAAATTQLMAYTALCLGLPLEGELAEYIALGLITDTGGFCHGNTTADVFALCALLVSNGCRLTDIRENLQNRWKIGRVRLWGKLLERVRFEMDGKIAICGVNLADLHEFHCQAEDLEGLVEWFRKVRGVEVAAVVKEQGPNLCKFSLRSCENTDVRAMAIEVGGGGHRNAAGGSIHASLKEALHILLQIIKNHLKHQCGNNQEIDNNDKALL